MVSQKVSIGDLAHHHFSFFLNETFSDCDALYLVLEGEIVPISSRTDPHDLKLDFIVLHYLKHYKTQ